MKIRFLTYFALIFTASIIFAGAIISTLEISSEGDNIKIVWHSTQEINLKEYVIERKTYNGAFAEIGRETAKGDNTTYVFVDENAFKTTGTLYIYRIGMIENGQISPSTYSSEISVSHNPSPVKRTWGSIKALFR